VDLLIVLLFVFFCSSPIWLLMVALYLTDRLRTSTRAQYLWAPAVLIGILATVSSVSYHECGWGLSADFYSQDLVPTVYRGWPFAWMGWTNLTQLHYPFVFFIADWLIWALLTSGALALLSILQVIFQVRLARMDKVALVGAIIVLFPPLAALAAGGRGCG
jgi:hypothetical protein